MEHCGWKHRLLVFFSFMVGYSLFYLLPNFRPPWPPLQLPLIPLDQAVPFLPWTFLIYVSDYLLFALVMYLSMDMDSFNSFSRMAFSVLVICGSFFLFFPTTYPRPPYPTGQPVLIQLVMNLISIADTPNNCFPSMHVALTGIATWSIRQRGRGTYRLFLLWSAAIFLSTLTTKQHYVVDIVGGLFVVCMVAAVEWVLFEKGYLRDLLARVRNLAR